MYGRPAILSIDLQLKQEDILETPLEQSLELHINKITKQLHQQRLQAQDNIQEAQQKQKNTMIETLGLLSLKSERISCGRPKEGSLKIW
ncbi:19639_t:CDS:2 [Dentiscutata erythropus]|uniref:19639_t:CDS:1 n=1 Tax=Dentiscutata erythropus TaxID=1348616 RepID=A0A9N9F2C8_9GLOM|nr:19639_t:CDS:2 [Dentiscutata erythropus]